MLSRNEPYFTIGALALSCLLWIFQWPASVFTSLGIVLSSALIAGQAQLHEVRISAPSRSLALLIGTASLIVFLFRGRLPDGVVLLATFLNVVAFIACIIFYAVGINRARRKSQRRPA